MVGSKERDNGGRNERTLVWSRANKGGCMSTAETVYKRVKKLHEKGRDVKSCCRSVATQLHLSEKEIEVVVAGSSDKWYKELGFDVREKI